jgi:hypothetical protein
VLLLRVHQNVLPEGGFYVPRDPPPRSVKVPPCDVILTPKLRTTITYSIIIKRIGYYLAYILNGEASLKTRAIYTEGWLIR